MTAVEQTTIAPAETAELRQRFRGALLRPGEEGYDEARRIWNGAIDRRPALIARCAGADDVVTAVRFARERELPFTVRGGGHGIAGHAVADGTLMVDLSLMTGVRVDPESRVARVAGGALLSHLDRATQQLGLAAPAGIISHTGVGGLTLGGGLGHLMRRHGLTVDNLLAVELVTAEGEQLRVDAESEPDLFWALRGGGGNFGVATAFELRLHPVGPVVLGGPIFWTFDRAREVLGFVGEYAGTAPDELGITVALTLAPPAPFMPLELVGRPVVGLVLVWCGDPAAGERAIAPLRAVAPPVADAVRPTPFVMLQSMLDPGAPHGRCCYWKAHRLPALAEPVVDVLVERMAAPTPPFAQINGWAVGGAVGRVDPADTAVGDRDAGFELSVIAAWSPPDPDGEAHRAWVREGWQALAPHAAGVYANFLSDEGAAGLRAAYGARLERLTAVKERWDPDNVFRFNANIPPGKGGRS